MDIIQQCLDFLKRSSAKYSQEITRQVRALECFSGNFWDDNTKKTYRRANSKKLCLEFSDWPVLANAISSPFSESPWHVQLISREGFNEELQDKINMIEQDNDYKSVSKSSFHRGVVCGSGIAVVTTDIDIVTGEPKVLLEFVQRQDSVALDPDILTVDGSDAEEGAIVNFISINKAKRLYGEDVLPFDYPNALPRMNFTGISQWTNEENKVQEVSYYKKNEKGTVTYYKICGNKVIEEIELPIKYIPIIRFAGYSNYGSDGIEYTGIVDKTYSLQLGLNIAYSTLMERANRSIKANLIASTDSVEGLDQYYKKMSDDDGLMILYNKGTTAPTPLIEQFQTGDLSDVINNTRNLIADVIGIPLSGIVGINDKTATEILIQETNRQSNVSNFYDNAYKANRTIARIIIELLNEGEDILFELENGPDVITTNMKHRQELQAVAGLLPQEMQPIVAMHMLDTIDSNFSEQIKNDVIANLDNKLKVTKQAEDPVAIHQMTQMQALLDQAMQELEDTKMENAELQKQYDALNLELINRKQDQMLDMYKFNSEQELKRAQLMIDANEAQVESESKVSEAVSKSEIEQIKLQKEMLSLEKEKMKVLGGMYGNEI